ncbi:MAG: type II secretion system major pseudopilin GspG [Sumerlaeia bacterium]
MLSRQNGATARRALTFLEMLFVVVIMGMLVAIIVPKFTNRLQTARIGAAKSQVHTLANSLNLFLMDVGRYPTDQEGLMALLEPPSSVSKELWDGPYVDSNALAPDPWKNPFEYKAPGEIRKEYDLWSNGPDGEPGTADDIGNWIPET